MTTLCARCWPSRPSACTALRLGAMTRTRLNTYDEAHWQGRREMRRNGMLTPLAAGGFISATLGAPKSRARFLSIAAGRRPQAAGRRR